MNFGGLVVLLVGQIATAVTWLNPGTRLATAESHRLRVRENQGLAALSRNDAVATKYLSVCADPNNLPFSNARSEGLENKLAELIAQDLNKKLVYTWWAERKGFVRNSLQLDARHLLVRAFEEVY